MAYSRNYYAVLGLTAPVMRGAEVGGMEIKSAYKMALLKAHPDKALRRGREVERMGEGEKEKENLAVKQTKTARRESLGSEEGRLEGCTFEASASPWTIDDVKEAYAILASLPQKAEYDTWLTARYNDAVLANGPSNVSWQHAFASGTIPSVSLSPSSATKNTPEFLAGLEYLDLSDFVVVESRENTEWRRSCRCGNEMGYRITEGELEGAEKEGRTEVVVGCWGCSLNLRVGFDVEVG